MATANREGLTEAEIEQLADRLEASTDPGGLTLGGEVALVTALTDIAA